MNDTLYEVRSVVDRHKLAAEIQAEFALFLRDTGTFANDYTNQDKLLWQLAVTRGYQLGLRAAQAALQDEAGGILEGR